MNRYRDDRRRYGEDNPGGRSFEGEHDVGQRRTGRGWEDPTPQAGAGPQRGFEDERTRPGYYGRRPYAHRERDYDYDPRGDAEYSYSGARGSMVSPGWDRWRGEAQPGRGHGEFGHGPYDEPAYGREDQGRSGYRSSWGASSEQLARGETWRGHGPQGYARSDERINEDICERLTDDPDVDPREVRVHVKDGVVTLEGRVDDRWMKHHIEDLVDATYGVTDIHNRIAVGTRASEQGSSGDTPTSGGDDGSQSRH